MRRIQKAPSPPPVSGDEEERMASEEQQEIQQQILHAPRRYPFAVPRVHHPTNNAPDGRFPHPGIPIVSNNSNNSCSNAMRTFSVSSSSGSSSASEQSPTWRRHNTSITDPPPATSGPHPDRNNSYRQERLARERSWDFNDDDAFPSLSSQTTSLSGSWRSLSTRNSTALPAEAPPPPPVQVRGASNNDEEDDSSVSLPSLTSFFTGGSGTCTTSVSGTGTATNTSASISAATTTTTSAVGSVGPFNMHSPYLYAPRRASSITAIPPPVPEPSSSSAIASAFLANNNLECCDGTSNTLAMMQSQNELDKRGLQGNRNRVTIVSCVLLLLPVTAVMTWAWHPASREELAPIGPESSPRATVTTTRLCPVETFLVGNDRSGITKNTNSQAHRTSQISNDFDDDPLSWGIQTVERSSSSSSSASSQQQQQKQYHDPEDATSPVPEEEEEEEEEETGGNTSSTLNEEEISLLVALQGLLAPSFDPPPSLSALSNNDHEDGEEEPCFPFTSTQRDALLWMVQQLILERREDGETTQDAAGNELDYEFQRSWDNKPSEEPQDRTTEEDRSTTTALLLRLDPTGRFDSSEDWLQTFVVSLLARTWDVAGTYTTSTTSTGAAVTSDADDGTVLASNTVTVVRTKDITTSNTRVVPFVPSSPLYLCGWQGLGCTGDGRLMSLEWSETNLDLTGTIPTELALLTDLVLLDLSFSPNLVGTIPTLFWGRNMKLKALYLESTGLMGPLPQRPGEGVLLTDLRLSSTPGIQQYGLPTGLFFERLSPHLKWFEWSSHRKGPRSIQPTTNTGGGLVDNTSSGTIPTELGLLTRLEGLSLDGNGFTGTVPVEIGRLTMLESLDLGYNHLNSGSLPTEIGQLVHLQWLSLQNSGLRGHLPMEIAALPHLEWLQLGGENNNFERPTLSALLQALPLDCSCGSWSSQNPTRTKITFSSTTPPPIPDECSCSVDALDGD